jgi:hypothetical protein
MAWLSAAPVAQAQASGPSLLRQATQLEAAGKLDAASDAYTKAAEAFQAAGDKNASAAAYGRAASASERNADQLLAGVASAPAGSVPAAPATRPTVPPRPVVAAPAVRLPVPAGPAPVAGHLVGNKPVGLFFVTKSILGNFRTMTYYFSPDGLAYENPLGLSAAELAATPARQKGRYSVSGKTLSIAWNGYPKPETDDMNSLGGGFGWSGGSIFSAVGPFQSPGQLVGTFEGGTSTYASAMGQATVSKTLTFKPDGTYAGSGVATATTVTERSVAETGGTSQQVGRWRLDGWYLTLTDAQGHSVRDIAYPVGTDKKVTLFNFNGLAYERK